jgi:1,2-diacylglycerol 3-beta-glucosyltransferase
MKNLLNLLRPAVLLFESLIGLIVGYLLMLTGAALFAPRRSPPRSGAPTHRFAILVPAHNEERLLPATLTSLHAMDYPPELFQVYVVADNCDDHTAELARRGGARVYERFNTELIGKGYALEWLLEHVWAGQFEHDGIVILDADTVVSPNFLRVMDARMARGERAIQAYYAVRDPESSRSAGLRAVALAVLHYLRPQGRMVLGGSTGLKGNGMVFAADIMRKHRWPASLTEDIEYHMALILAGERVMFAPDAQVQAEMPDTLDSSQSQNVRWERGRVEMVQNYVPRLLREAVRRRSFLLFDAAVEQLIPPYSVVAGASVAGLIAAAALRSRPAVLLGLALIKGQVVYIFTGLALSRAPRHVYLTLLYAPFFVLWKIWLYMRVLLGRNPQDWIRTRRNTGIIHK